ncbi:MAG: tRNA epoxyqueuosine(34) reductase QueG [Candidatus Sericytochromatia bacterium]
MNLEKNLTTKIKEYAYDLGFSLIGITNSEEIGNIDFYNQWIENGYAGEMEYLKRNIEKRHNPKELLPETKSIVCLAYNYYTNYEPKKFKIAKYALNNDYHDFFKEKINLLFEYIKTLDPSITGRTYVDTAPILERELAVRAGLGWIGKNTLLVNNKKGSYFLLGEIFLNIDLNYDNPFNKNHCGSCNRCMIACPTNAIIKEGVLDASKCISYLTIESKNNIPEEHINNLNGYILGCDICQDVCPWNKTFASITHEENFQKRPWIDNLDIEDLLKLDQETFSKTFKNSPIKRAKLKGFLRNIIAMISKSKDKKYLSILDELAKNEEEIIKNQAILAIKKINEQ